VALPSASLEFVMSINNVGLDKGKVAATRFVKRSKQAFVKMASKRGRRSYVKLKGRAGKALDKLETKVHKELDEIRGGSAEALLNVLTFIRDAAVVDTPIDTGRLRASAFAVAEDLKTVARGKVGFDITSGTLVGGATANAPYAVFVHEIDKNYRVGGWKFLQRAVQDIAPSIPAMILDEMSRISRRRSRPGRGGGRAVHRFGG
jgi:hypothetical protein